MSSVFMQVAQAYADRQRRLEAEQREREAKRKAKRGFTGSLVGAVAGGALTLASGGTAGLALAAASAGSQIGSGLATENNEQTFNGLLGAASVGAQINSANSISAQSEDLFGSAMTPQEVMSMQAGGGLQFLQGIANLRSTVASTRLQEARTNVALRTISKTDAGA